MNEWIKRMTKWTETALDETLHFTKYETKDKKEGDKHDEWAGGAQVFLLNPDVSGFKAQTEL